MVELLSPIALPDALAEASLGFRGCWYYGSRGLIVLIDWGQSIYHFRSTRSGGVFGLRLFCLSGCGAFEALIDWGQSIYHFRTTQKRRVLWFFKKSHRIQMLASGTKRIKMKRSISA
jgi:hypothetical protein